MKTLNEIRTHVAGREGDPPVLAGLTCAEVRALLAELDALRAWRVVAEGLASRFAVYATPRDRATYKVVTGEDYPLGAEPGRWTASALAAEAKPDARCTRDTGCGETPCICDPSKPDA